MKCRNPECGADVRAGVLFCGKCGTPVRSNCTECGAPIPVKKSAKCCPKCGTLISDMKDHPSAPVPEVKPVPAMPPVSDLPKITHCTGCGAPLPDKKNAKCCPKCGMMISEMLKKGASSGSSATGKTPSAPPSEKPLFCTVCGTPIPSRKGSKCCPKCGTMFSDMKQPASPVPAPAPAPVPAPVSKPLTFCTACGKPLNPGDAFCRNCRTPVNPPEKPVPTPVHPPKPTVKNDSAKKALIVVLVIGLCLLWTGFGGKLIMVRMHNLLSDVLRKQGSYILDQAAGGVAENMMIAVLQNNPEGFGEQFRKITSTAGSLLGSSGGLEQLITGGMSAAIREQFPDLRRQVSEQVPPVVWIVMVLASFYRIFLIIGAVLAIGSAVLWLVVLNGKLNDIREQKMMPVCIAGGVWIMIITVITIIAMVVPLNV